MSMPAPDPLCRFHPAVAGWFSRSFPAPTPAQAAAWPLVRAGRSTLVAAPTGSGKTLTAFLAAIDALVQQGLTESGLVDGTQVLYVSPLKALSNDIHINLEQPLAGIGAELQRLGLPPVDIRTAVRTGDTPQAERNAMRKRVPHILVTTPESLYVLLGSESGRQMLRDVRSVIVDEIHAIAGNKRGSHLALSLERLEALCERPLVRVGLSATQKPIDAVARFLVGTERPCEIVDIGYGRARDLALEVPPVPLEAVMSNDAWALVYDRLAALAGEHRTTLVFVNTRRMAERTTRHLAERLGGAVVAAHHGSLAREQRLTAEQKLKRGELRVLVATASLELGIDIGDVELVCQLGSPRSIAAFLQRVGRAGHQVAGVSKGRLFPSSRDDLIECAALLDAVRRGELDTLRIPPAPLDVLAQQIVAEVSSREWQEDALLALLRRAMPYAVLDDATYQALLRMLAEGYTTRHGARGAYLHRDLATRSLRGRRGGRLTALTSGGTIADNSDYAVLLEPQGLNIGTVNEDFAVESLAGDVFQLGNTSYRILKIEAGRVRVEDAQGMPPSIPFWLGEAPGRSDELSFAVARLRGEIDQRLASAESQAAERLQPVIDWLADTPGIPREAAQQIVEYLSRARAALGALPTQRRLIMERFFDESGGTQLVIHSPYGSRINRAWGLALRKRFCRTFNFELQAAATEDAIILSLSTSHSFALDEVWRYLHSASAEQVLIQALLDAPLFGVRWRWIATTALALPRMAGGRKVAPQLQRMKSEDLLATVFPDQVACLENIVGEREIPDHPLVRQTLDDCLHEAMDSEGWLSLLRRMERGEVELLTRDLPSPSPLAMEILGARPYAFLDDAPLEERRTQAVLARRWSDPESTDDLGALDPEAIAAVGAEAWPEARNSDELHEALTALGCIAEAEAAGQPHWLQWLAELARAGRATRLQVAHDRALWTPLERLAWLRSIYPQAACEPCLPLPAGYDQLLDEEEALVELIRARLSGFAPLPVPLIARPLALPASAVALALTRLEAQGYVLRGRFGPGASEDEWCERHLLARIHRYTVKRLRRDIEPVELADCMRFLADWQHLSAGTRMQGREALGTLVEQLEGFQAAATAWESDLLPARLKDYGSTWLDELCRSGRIVWTRLSGRLKASGGPVRGTPIVLLPRRQLGAWHALASDAPAPELSSRAQRVFDCLQTHGALFFDELQHDAHLLRSELEDALGELVAVGLVNADSFAGLRALLTPASKRSRTARRTRGGAFIGGMADAGRWALVRKPVAGDVAGHAVLPIEALEHIARVLLRRYGVVFWRLLAREADWLPPWRELLRVYHRLEARGEIRGGRFVAGVAGEQFALPEALALLREVRKRPLAGELLAVSAVDPLNQLGTLLPGSKVPALPGNRILYRDGVPLAALVAGKPQWLLDLDEPAQREALRRLISTGH
ncbi:DEAD/DEAH box helicase [Pseudomonas sp. WS 5018]|uniref:DEAD/DEAH box helicase n=2 Tax=Stutzerimonas stutzeri TaxID=316 RepID=A0AA42H9I7_STUST|nr:DEAD/DEAH box helicase [Stutzerimonas stutzeri]NMY64804.1 DEAD/DEAH box helicase [Pseudomonas sp. WS 5018]MDH0148308.1 DEAD/DEAH box helicase [Stutzerimonas stutzeri]MDH0152678.1 DEAD/DEAH box helicase [Stutzerimonas stutzeri]MDH0154549.1 DEAD/DEAH box helicase [Stutzerimonas stutzeri]MDH0611007.1 DEAD/DEAH box helicase [Stutzerimonas stutzeri]